MMQVIFNNINSYTDLNIFLESFNIQPPSKKKIKETIPFMNGSYDFSSVCSNGEVVYGERLIKIKFNLSERNRTSLYIKYSQVLEWLLNVGQKQLIFTDMPDYYYLAEVEDAPSFETIVKRAGIMEVEFVAHPFKYGKNNEGADIWDYFNFETDYAQETKYSISGSKIIEIYNPSAIKITPSVVCSAPIEVTKGSTTYKFNIGNTKDWRFNLDKGKNNLTIKGTGTIEFIFRKEVF